MQEDRAAGRERQRVRDCVPVFWSVCSFFLRLLCVHVCVCAWVCWCVCVCVFAQFEGHPGRDCSADLSHPHTSPLFTWLSICPHIYHQKQISCWKQIQVSKLYLLHEATVNSEQIVCVCVYGNINEFSPAYKRQKARLKMVRRLYCVWTNTQTKCVVDSCSAVLSIWTSKHIHKLSVCLRARTTLKSGPICFCFFSYNIVIKMRSIYVKYESSPLCKFATFMFLKISICNVHSCLSTICTPARWILASSRWQPFYMVR